MFDKLAKTPAYPSKSSNLPSLVATSSFLACGRDQGFRLSYGAFAIAARQLGEDTNTQIPAQRGGKLVGAIDLALQPYVCKKSGKYSKGVDWKNLQVPSDLGTRPVIEKDDVVEAIQIWQDAQSS